MERRRGSFRAMVKEFGFFNAVIGTIQAKTDQQRITFIREQREQDQRLIDGYERDRSWKERRRGLNPAPTKPRTA